MSAGHELLFGFLALQNDCISRKDLIAAVQVWLQDKSKPLAEILVQQKSIDAGECDLLQRLTERHLKRHGDDPQKSLAVVSSLGELQATLIKFGDPDVEASLAAVNRPGTPQPSMSGGSNLDATLIPQRTTGGVNSDRATDVSRFRILRPHARGGLGEVFVARDEELNREVALKEIQTRFADDTDSRNRFVLEAEVTGGLEHPGIVPVYGLGQYEDGRPYYAMRFIKGDSLKEAIDEFHGTPSRTFSPAVGEKVAGRPDEGALSKAESGERKAGEEPDYNGLAFRKLLGRFVDVCEAISYAHSRGVLHRDLKPGNIMLGKYGETLVVDWGLAKVQDRDDSSHTPGEAALRPSSGSGVTPTMFGSVIGTPAYMPPEQAVGSLDELGPESDVYSLGATLYHLLTGQSAFPGGDYSAVLEDVKAGRFTTPRGVRGDVPRSLEAVCLQAMALKPVDRYSSPQLLADDIEHYLADEPVSAFPEPVILRARRWARKHQTLTVTTAAVLLVSVISLGTFSTILGGKNADLRSTNDQLAAANIREHDARSLAQANEASAREQGQLALSTLTSVISDIQGGLEGLPGGGEVRRRLLKTSLEKLGSVSSKYIAQSTIDRNTWLALNEMGDVILQFGTDSSSSSVELVGDTASRPRSIAMTEENRSATKLAESVFVRAFDIATKLAEADPDNAETQRQLSVSLDHLSDVFLKLGRTDEALARIQDGLKIRRMLVAADPYDAAKQRDLSISIENLGNVFLNLGRTDEAFMQLQDKLKIDRALVDGDPQNADYQRNLSIAFDRLGDVFLRQGRTDDALTQYQESWQVSRVLAETHTDDARIQLDYWIAFNTLGDVFLTLGRTDEALTQFQEGVKVCRALAEADPHDVQNQRHLSIAFNRLGNVFMTLGRMNDARAQLQEGLRISRVLAEKDPDNVLYQRDLTVSFELLGRISLALGETDLALTHFQDVSKIARVLAEADPSDAQKQRDLAISFERLGQVSLALGKTEDALKYFNDELAIAIRRTQADPSDVDAQRFTSVVYDFLGNGLSGLGRTDEALRHFLDALKIRRGLAEADPNNTEKQNDLPISFDYIGDAFLTLSQPDEALKYFQDGLKIRRALAEADPNNAERRNGLMISNYKIGLAQQARGEYTLAADSFDAGAVVLKSMIEDGMNVELSKSYLVTMEHSATSARLMITALGDWDMILQQPADTLPALLDTRGIAMTKRFDFTAAAQSAGKLSELDNATNGQLYNAACVFSLCAASVKAVEGSELTVEQVTQRDEWINAALATLKQSIEKGWTDFAHMQQDSDLTILRDLPDFKALMPPSSPM